MPRATPLSIGIVGSSVLAVLAASGARADVTLTERIAVEGQGLMAMANMTGTSTLAVSGKRARTDSDVQMQSRLVRMFARGVGQTTEIVRLDDDKVYEINPKKREYTETSLTERRAQLERATEQARQQREKQPAPTGIDESECEWSEPTADVTRTGAKANIAGFSAEQVSVIAKQSCKDRKSGAVCDIALYLDQWVAPGFDGADEVTRYRMAYAQQMGVLNGGQDVTERAEALFGRYSGAWSKVVDKMRDIKGYPVRTSFAFALGGPKCQGQGDGGSQTAANDGGGTGSGAGPGGLAGQIAGSIFGRKKKQQDEAQAAAPAAPLPAALAGMVVPIRVSSEVVSVSKAAVPADAFEVPPGLKKVSQ